MREDGHFWSAAAQCSRGVELSERQDGPLAGVKVLDLTQMMAGPFCTMLLADMGADVVKVEKPDGDDIRRAGPPFINGESAAFLGINRNKRGIVANLGTAGGVEVIRRLAQRVDVLVQNMRPGSMQRKGLAYDDLSDANPGLIYCTISGFGTTGPYSARPGFDLVAQAMSGLMSITGEPGGPPLRHGVPVTDLAAGIYGAFGILAAYIDRLRTGRGQHVETSLLEAGIAYTIWESAIYFATGEPPGPVGSGHPLATPYQAFPTRNGHIMIGAANQANWERLCRAMSRADLLDDPRFTDNVARRKHGTALVATLEETFLQHDTEHWLGVLDDAGVPNGPINDLRGVYDDPQVAARGMVEEMEHPVAGVTKHIGIPLKLSATPGSIRMPAPTLGQHTDDVLAEYGFKLSEVADLRDAGAVR